MKRLAIPAFLIFVGSLVGCGVEQTDPSAAAPPTTPEQVTSEIEEAVDSGQIDPATYGKE